jgi:hypothetical protein
MLAELAHAEPRALSYWAQQLAFGPVLLAAVRLRQRHAPFGPSDRASLAPCLRLAADAFGALPEVPGGDPVTLRLLAARQARAICWGRRRILARLLGDLGMPLDGTAPLVPARMVRPYPVMGFRPSERFPG